MNFLSFTARIAESSSTTKNSGPYTAFSRRSLPKAVSPVREPKDTGPEAWPPVKIK